MSPVSENAVALMPAVPIWTQADPVHRSILKPVSVVELSVQAKLIWVEELAVATRLAGAAGGASRVVALAMLEYAEEPKELVAFTR